MKFPFHGEWIIALALFAGLAAGGAVDEPRTEAEIQAKILEGARIEAAKQTPYIQEYRVIAYPGGDVPAGTGVCTDLVIRAFRHAGYDIQKLLHEDREAHPDAYPTYIWNHKTSDPSLDHRRCQNLVTWFRRYARELPKEITPETMSGWQGGDIVFFAQKGSAFPWHVAIVSDKQDFSGIPLLVDSYPPSTSETRLLGGYGPIHSHFRIPEGGPVLQRVTSRAGAGSASTVGRMKSRS